MPEEPKIKEKDIAVDLLRGLAILAVIFGHIASPLTGFIFSWHMPLFFFVSGFFIRIDESVKIFLIKNFKRIMLYFFVFALIGFLATYFRNIFLNRENESVLSSLTGIFFWMDFEHLNHYGFVLWFLPALFWGKFINYLFLKYLKNKWLIGALILMIFSLVVSLKIKLPFALDIGLISSLWIFLGYLVFNFFKEKILKYWAYLAIIIFSSLLLLPVPGLNLSVRYFSFPVYNVLYSFLIIIFLFIATNKIVAKIKRNNLLVYLGQNSMFLFVFHPYTNNIAYLIVDKYFNNLWYLKFIFSFALIYLVLIIFRKYLNKGIFKYV